MNFERIRYDRPRRQSQVTYLEMFRWEERAVDWPPDMRVDRAPELTAHDYRLLYNRVGADHEWTDRNRIADEDLLERISGDQIVIHVLRDDGKVAGYSEVRLSLPDEVELVYFGLVPEYRGRGLGNALWYSGHPDQAVAVCEKGRTRATRLRHAMTECCVLFWEIVVHSLRGDFDMLRVRSEECIEIAHRENLGHWISLVSVYSSLAKAFDGDPEVGLAQLDAATADMQRVGYDTSKPYIMLNRSHILALNGRDEEALATIEQAISIALKAQELVSFSELRRLRGEFLLEYRNDPVGAEREFRDALAFARTQNALSYELRISTSLANLMRRRGEAARALELLAPVYDRFAEGFGTADLVAAKKTIDELKLSIGAATS